MLTTNNKRRKLAGIYITYKYYAMK